MLNHGLSYILYFFIIYSHQLYFTENDIYGEVEGEINNRRLNRTHRFGFASDGKGVIGKIVVFEGDNITTYDNLKEPIVPLIDYQNLSVKTIETLKQRYNLKGLMVWNRESRKKVQKLFEFFSKRPFDKLKPNNTESFNWNEKGDDLRNNDYPFPILKIKHTKESENLLKKNKTWLKLTTEMLSKTNSKDCLKKNRCWPVIGQSIWSIFPSTNFRNKDKIIISATTGYNFLFRSDSGKNRENVGGLIALMAVADSFRSNKKLLNHFTKKNLTLLYTIFDGQDEGLLGSEYFAKNMKSFRCIVENSNNGSCKNPILTNYRMFQKLSYQKVRAVIDIGFISNYRKKILTNNLQKKQLFYYKNRKKDEVSKDLEKIIKSLNKTNSTIILKEASSPNDNIKIPPSSAWSFMKNSNVPIIHISDHDGAYEKEFEEVNNDFDDSFVHELSSLLLHAIAKEIGYEEEVTVSSYSFHKALNCVTKSICPSIRQNRQDNFLDFYKFSNFTSIPNFVKNIFEFIEHSTEQSNVTDFVCKLGYCTSGDLIQRESLLVEKKNIYHFSGTYLHPAIDPGLKYDYKEHSWSIIDEETEILVLSQTGNLNGSTFEKEDKIVSWSVFAIGIGIFALSFILGLFIKRKYIDKIKIS